MYYPSIFDDNFCDDLFDEMFNFPFDFGKRFKTAAVPTANRMTTDIREYDDKYELDMELPGYDKLDVAVELKEGYLIVSAEHDDTKETGNAVAAEDGTEVENADATKTDKKDTGKYIRRERFYGKMSRSFYVGENVKREDISANFNNGVLKLFVNKVKEEPKVEEQKYIPIEG